MLSIIHGYERSTRQELFKAMFRQRKAIFIDQKKWDLKAVDSEFEIDEFDRDDAVYLCSLRPDGALAASVRFLNTMTEHVAGSVSPQIFSGLIIRSPTIWETTRFALPQNDLPLQPNGIPHATCEIIVGMCLFGLQYGVTQMTAIYEAKLARVFRKCGLVYHVVGRNSSAEHGVVHYGLCDISRGLEASVRSATQLAPYLLESGGGP